MGRNISISNKSSVDSSGIETIKAIVSGEVSTKPAFDGAFAPTISITNGTNYIPSVSSFSITGSSYTSLFASNMGGIQTEIYSNSSLTNLLLDQITATSSESDTFNLSSLLPIPYDKLYIRVRYISDQGGVGDWSDVLIGNVNPFYGPSTLYEPLSNVTIYNGTNVGTLTINGTAYSYGSVIPTSSIGSTPTTGISYEIPTLAYASYHTGSVSNLSVPAGDYKMYIVADGSAGGIRDDDNFGLGYRTYDGGSRGQVVVVTTTLNADSTINISNTSGNRVLTIVETNDTYTSTKGGGGGGGTGSQVTNPNDPFPAVNAGNGSNSPYGGTGGSGGSSPYTAQGGWNSISASGLNGQNGTGYGAGSGGAGIKAQDGTGGYHMGAGGGGAGGFGTIGSYSSTGIVLIKQLL